VNAEPHDGPYIGFVLEFSPNRPIALDVHGLEALHGVFLGTSERRRQNERQKKDSVIEK
jgi:hypothetical protein